MNISLMDLPGQYARIGRSVLPKIHKALSSGRYVLGPEVAQFEKVFAASCGARYCVGTSSGTESLILSLRALGVGEKDEVITVPNTFTATAEAVSLVGARVVFCDIDRQTMNLDPLLLARHITTRTKAIIPVHMHGNPADMDPIMQIAKKHKIPVVEDAAQAFGATYKGKTIGSLSSNIACFSFHPVKNLGAYGDAGCIVTNSKKYMERIRLMINHGRSSHNTHILIGTTGRLDTIQAVVLSEKLKYISAWHARRSKLVARYKKALPSQCRFIEDTPDSTNAHHIFAVLTSKRDSLAKFLGRHGIETGMHYPIPLHLQKAYKHLGYKRGDFPESEYYAAHTLSLPLYPHMRYLEVDYVVSHIKRFYEKA